LFDASRFSFFLAPNLYGAPRHPGANLGFDRFRLILIEMSANNRTRRWCAKPWTPVMRIMAASIEFRRRVTKREMALLASDVRHNIAEGASAG
jgi:hypothetical protein